MNAILANVQKLERETREERREFAGHLAVGLASLGMALVTAYVVVMLMSNGSL